MHRSHYHGIHGLGRYRSCDPEVCHLNFSILRDQHVLRLNISVDDMLLVGSLNSLCDLDRDPDRFLYI